MRSSLLSLATPPSTLFPLHDNFLDARQSTSRHALHDLRWRGALRDSCARFGFKDNVLASGTGVLAEGVDDLGGGGSENEVTGSREGARRTGRAIGLDACSLILLLLLIINVPALRSGCET
ncbi:hypothetical protein BD309DRAFT_973868 [Dichomitus squalens]|nr:hypothetical protein BD309DRAFT_973868 [Dichomitus squalens]